MHTRPPPACLVPGLTVCYHGNVDVRQMLSRDRLATAAGLLAPLALAAILVPFRTGFANTDAALAMLLVVVAVAANGHRLAGDLAAISAAVWFDFFLTRPYQRFAIASRTDVETTVLLLVIGVAVTEFAVRGRREHAVAARRAGYLDGINDTARSVAAGHSPGGLIEQVCAQIAQLLSLRSCQFQAGVAGLGRPARLRHDGQVVIGEQVWDADHDGLPSGLDTELLVEYRGVLQGRFLMSPRPGARPSREQRLLAVAFADQVAAALAAGLTASR
jgi:K+-sensing histidine kinase KdpD